MDLRETVLRETVCIFGIGISVAIILARGSGVLGELGRIGLMNRRLRAHKATFLDVLHNSDDQVIVRRLVDELMPDLLKAEIVRRFNADVDRWNAATQQIDMIRAKD